MGGNLHRSFLVGKKTFAEFLCGEWKAEKEASLAESDDEYTGLSQKFFLWTIPQRTK